jgi:hypothetical protein
MPETIGQHNVAAFTAPVNGSPLDANVVRANDNGVRTGHNAHDNDPGVHIQSSLFSVRPPPGVPGRKWVTNDTGTYELWFDTGTAWAQVTGNLLLVNGVADANLAAGDVVKVTGFDGTLAQPTVNKVTALTDTGFGIVMRAALTGESTPIIVAGIFRGLDTSAFTSGALLYSDGTGGFTATPPASGPYQQCAIVLRAHATDGVIFVQFDELRTTESSSNVADTLVRRDGSGNFAANVITANSIVATVPASSVSPGTFPAGSFSIQNLTVTGTLTASIATVAASAVQPGTFATGNFTFPQSLTINQSLTVDTNVLRVDHVNNRVGTNVTTPLAPYHGVGTHRVDGLIDLSSAATTGFIKFPPSPSPTADVSTLDMYLEGGWTPGATDPGLTSYTVFNGNAVKIGRLVFVNLYCNVTSTDPDPFVLTNLPHLGNGGGLIFLLSARSSKAGFEILSGFVNNNEVGLYLPGGLAVTYTDLDGESLWITGCYYAST